MMKKMIPFMAAAALFLGADTLQAQSGCSKSASECSKKCGPKSEQKAAETPAPVEFSAISHDQLLELQKAEGVIIFDARNAESFAEGHIDGAVLYTSNALPEDKATSMVFYCGGPRCSAAPKAARGAIELGYTNVMVFTGGWMEWTANLDDSGSQAGL